MKQTDNIEYFEIQSIEYNLGLIYVVYHLSQNIFRLRRTRASRANSGIQRISNLGRICLPRASQSAGTHRQSSERAESLDSRDFSKRASVQLTL